METSNHTPALIITRAELEDLPTILALQKLAFLREAKLYNNYEIEPLIQTLEQAQQEWPGKYVLKAISGSTIVGSARGFEEQGTCYIQRVVVLPEWQGRGIGKRLMQSLEEHFQHVRRFELFTGHKSAGNLALYEGLGYKRFAERNVAPELSFVYLEKLKNQVV